MLPTNLLDMVNDPYSEDRQLAAPKEIVDLVEKFENNLESYKRHYNETQVRIEFVNPFFKPSDGISITSKVLLRLIRTLSMRMLSR